MNTKQPSRGFLLGDALLALVLAMVLLMAITATVAQQSRTERKLAESRTAWRSLETTALQWQAGAPAPTDLNIETLPDPAPPGHAWVRLRLGDAASVPQRTLIALVPRGRLPSPVVPGGAQP